VFATLPIQEVADVKRRRAGANHDGVENFPLASHGKLNAYIIVSRSLEQHSVIAGKSGVRSGCSLHQTNPSVTELSKPVQPRVETPETSSPSSFRKKPDDLGERGAILPEKQMATFEHAQGGSRDSFRHAFLR